MKKINLGIIAHVDAGKTTVTEQLLYLSGVIKEAGRVDLGNTQTDSMELERKRGITIKATTTSFDWKGVKINLIDTPGHADFIAEVERSLRVLDGVILVISAREGIQSQTRILFETVKSLNIPIIIFINKLDRVGSDYNKLVNDLKNTLSDKVVSLQSPYNEGSKDVILGELYDDNTINNHVMDVLCDLDDNILDMYVSDKNISKDFISHKVSRFSKEGKLYPILCGSSIMNLGIDNLLNGITEYLPYADECVSNPLSAVVFKIGRETHDGKKIYIRLFEGIITVRDVVETSNKSTFGKINKIHLIKNGKLVEANTIEAGDIAIIYGIDTLRIGDVIGTTCSSIRELNVTKPILKTRVSTLNKSDNTDLFKALTIMAEEDPLLDLEVDKTRNHIYLNLFGYVQMEILTSLLNDLYGIKIKFSSTLAIYKETPIGSGYSFIPIFGHLNPYAAEIGLKVEPLERGSGIQYVSDVSYGSLSKSFQTAVEEAVFDTLKQGLLGWEVTDIKVTFTDSYYNSVDSTPSDFRNLAPMVLMDALNKAKTKLLEPLYEFELQVCKSKSSRAISDLQKMRATLNECTILEDNFIVKGLVPVETSKYYTLQVANYTEGKGKFSTKFYGYNEPSINLNVINENCMINPLNKKEYLLYKLNTVRNV